MAKTGSKNSNFLPITIGMVIAGLFVINGMDGHKALVEKITSQKTLTDKVNAWKQSYIALKDTVGQFEKSYTATSEIKDMRALVAMLEFDKIGLRADSDHVTLSKSVTETSTNLKAIDLSQLCLGNSASGALEVSANNYGSLIKGIAELEKRTDVTIGNLSIQNVQGKPPKASLTNFCVFVRNQ